MPLTHGLCVVFLPLCLHACYRYQPSEVTFSCTYCTVYMCIIHHKIATGTYKRSLLESSCVLVACLHLFWCNSMAFVVAQNIPSHDMWHLMIGMCHGTINMRHAMIDLCHAMIDMRHSQLDSQHAPCDMQPSHGNIPSCDITTECALRVHKRKLPWFRDGFTVYI